MNIDDVRKMPDEELRIKVAELYGWRRIRRRETTTKHFPHAHIPYIFGIHPSDHVWRSPIPDYPHDLNSMHEAVETLRRTNGPEWHDFGRNLLGLCGSTMNCIQATARKRAEAFVLTMSEK